MAVANPEELVHPGLQSIRVVLVHDAAEKNPHGIESQFLRPAQFGVDESGRPGVRAPHLYLVDGIGRYEVAS